MSFYLFFMIAGVFNTCSGENDPVHAYSPGDIVIGGLFPLHIHTDRNTTHGPSSCSGYDLPAFLQSQVMIYAIREINQHTPRVLPNITIGYDIYDTCGDVSLAIRATLQMLKADSDPQSCLVPEDFHSALPEPKTKAVIGERHSEVSIAVARIVALSSVTQISYASTSELLSRKLKFPTFLRTISSDEYQTKAIVELVEEFNWKTVAIVGSYDEYGKYGSDTLLDIFRTMEDICIDFVEILPSNFSRNGDKGNKRLDDLVSEISASFAEAIILFTKESNVDVIMKAAIRHKLNRTWIASDSWSTSPKVASLPDIELAGQVFGFISKRNEVPGFKDYVLSMFNGTSNAILGHYLTQYPPCVNQSEPYSETKCSLTNSQQESTHCLDIRCLATFIDQDQSFNAYLAVKVIAEGLRRLLQCDSHRCKRETKFTALELLLEIKKVNLTVNNAHIAFDSRGDPSLGYDVLFWDIAKSEMKTIGEYWPHQGLNVSSDELVTQMRGVQVTAYNCSKTCEPGRQLEKQGETCCYNCVPCADGDFSPGNGTECQSCGNETVSSPRKDRCLEKETRFVLWSDSFVIILSCLSGFGIIVVIVFAALFTIYRSTPIVKAVGGYLSFLELLSLLTCFCLTFTFYGKPTDASCSVGLPFSGISISLCITCILANLFQILVGFNFEAGLGSWVKKLNKPVVFVPIIAGIQVALCVSWFCFNPPKATDKILPKELLAQCTSGSTVFFVTTVSYNAALAVTCFFFAYQGRELPDLYKNATLISISMMLFLIIWILLIPIYLGMFGQYRRAIQSAAILIFSYSILGFHMAPKCYIMLFRREINNERAITEYIRKHYESKNLPVVKS